MERLTLIRVDFEFLNLSVTVESSDRLASVIENLLIAGALPLPDSQLLVAVMAHEYQAFAIAPK